MTIEEANKIVEIEKELLNQLSKMHNKILLAKDVIAAKQKTDRKTQKDGK